MKILIADDSRTSRALLCQALEPTGHEILAVENGARALAVYESYQPAVLITDWQMPELDGLELVHELRAMRAARYTWVIMLTASDFKSNYAKTIQAGVDDYLTKPLDRDLLLTRIEVARRVVELHHELSLLKRVIPLCMSCHSVRDTSADWVELDQYLRRQTGVDFSHGLCPDCYFTRSVLPELVRHEGAGPAAPLEGELSGDLLSYACVVGERLADGLERRGPGPHHREQLALLGRLAAALRDDALSSLARVRVADLQPAALRLEVSRLNTLAERRP
jgi:CheY-like chemotaxis protein